MDDITLDDIIEILEGVQGNVDYANEEGLVTKRILNSFDILSIVEAIDDDLDIEVPAKEIVPANFDSARAILEMVTRLADE